MRHRLPQQADDDATLALLVTFGQREQPVGLALAQQADHRAQAWLGHLRSGDPVEEAARGLVDQGGGRHRDELFEGEGAQAGPVVQEVLEAGQRVVG